MVGFMRKIEIQPKLVDIFDCRKAKMLIYKHLSM